MKQESAQPAVLLTGGTGQLGIFALPRLLAAGYPVFACSRRISRESGKAAALRTNNVYWFHPDTILGTGSCNGVKETGGVLQDVSVLLSCGPVALAAQLAPHCPQLQQVVCVSSSSVYTKLLSPDPGERGLIAAIKDSEDALRRYCKAHDIALVLLRPTLIYGCGLDRNVSRIARLVKRFHFMPVAGQAAGRRQPLHADDLAKLLLSMLEASDLSDMESPVGGGSIITYRELVERIFTGLGRAPRILHMPPRVLATLVRAVSWLPFATGLNAEIIYRQNRDQFFDDSVLRRQFGFDPRPFEPAPEDFSVPAAARILQPK